MQRLFSQSARDKLSELLGGFEQGHYPKDVDLPLETAAQQLVTLSVSFSSVLHEENAILFSFRNVTDERETAVELKQTKEFLESVIDSSVDAIVSADTKGTVLLFNRSASRVFQYKPEDVIGKMNVDRLYPSGVAHKVMRQIKSSNHGGYGRLEDWRVDMLGADGENIPVKLSAALVMDRSQPIATVGIFTDIRESLRMEQSLSRAEDELRVREKQSVLTELAGATAHELNQPLTTILGYTELLGTWLTLEGKAQEAQEALDSIGEASERMATIVQKLGKLTQYETKAYVGQSKILDLDQVALEPPQDTAIESGD